MLKFFFIYWLISIFLASIRVLDIFEVSSYTFLLVFLGVISFCVGFLLIGFKRNARMVFVKEDFSCQFEKILNNSLYRIVMVLASLYIFSLLIIFFNKIAFYGSLYDVRTDYYSADLYGPLFAQVNAFILKPLYWVALPIFAYSILYKFGLFTIIQGFYLFGYESLGGGRIGYVRILLGVLFVAICLLRTYQNNKKKGYSILLVAGISLFALLSLITAARKGSIGGGEETRKIGVETTIEHIVSYTACPIAAFDYSINHNYESLIGGYQFGALTLTPVSSAINLFTSRVGFSLPIPLNELVEIKQNSLIDIAPEHDWNALYTANLYFYNDLGLMGVIIFPLLFGLLISFLIGELHKYKSLPLVMLVLFCFWCMLDSVLDYAIVSPYEFLTMVIFYLLGTRSKYLSHR